MLSSFSKVYGRSFPQLKASFDERIPTTSTSSSWIFYKIFHFVHVNSFLSDLTKTSANDEQENRVDGSMSLHPYFDFDVPRNITARVGQTAFLHCRVEQLGDKSVRNFIFQHQCFHLNTLTIAQNSTHHGWLTMESTTKTPATVCHLTFNRHRPSYIPTLRPLLSHFS